MSKSKGVDVAAVKMDYETGGYSLRMLTGKYGVPRSTLCDWVKRYGWEQRVKPVPCPVRALRQEAVVSDAETVDISDRRTTAETVPLPVDRDYELIRAYTHKLLSKADDLLELSEALAPRDLKSLSSMLLDVRTLLGILSPREAAEQELRLATMRKQLEARETDGEKTDQTIVVEFVGTNGAEV